VHADWTSWFTQHWVEIFGFITGVVNLYLLVRQKIWNWPVGIANNLLYVVVFFQARFFSDMSLQVIYIVLGIIGWYLWLHGGERGGELNVSRTPRLQLVLLILGGCAATIGESLFLRKINDAAPLLDAFTTVFSLIAQYQLTRKFIENWWLWIIVDVVSVGLYAYKGLYWTSALYALFFGLCVAGLMEWRRSLDRHLSVRAA